MNIWSRGVLGPFWAAGGAKDGPRVSNGGPKGGPFNFGGSTRSVLLEVFGAAAKTRKRLVFLKHGPFEYTKYTKYTKFIKYTKYIKFELWNFDI